MRVPGGFLFLNKFQGVLLKKVVLCFTKVLPEEPGTHGLHYAQYWPLDPKKARDPVDGGHGYPP